MKKKSTSWTIGDLLDNVVLIDFPEYQREPNVWNLEKKQRLIDSILRGFDISTIYLYRRKKGYDCIDGRQRINAILSYVGRNEKDVDDNEFHLKITNEIYTDKGTFKDVQNKRYSSLPFKWQQKLKLHQLTVVEMSDVSEPEELNLLFLRLQLGTILNSGEKLHAMAGDMRDFIFNDFAQDDLFKKIRIPYRRYAREQVAAQIVINVFGKAIDGEFRRARYIDLQEFFKTYVSLDGRHKSITASLKKSIRLIDRHLKGRYEYVSNRAVTLSAFLILYSLADAGKTQQLSKFGGFLKEFVLTLRWQIAKGIDLDRPYQDFLKFQTHVTQASVEKSAIEFRDEFLRRYFDYFLQTGLIKGDKEFKKQTHRDPASERGRIEKEGDD